MQPIIIKLREYNKKKALKLVKNNSIAHYKRMIKYAKSRNPNDSYAINEILRDIEDIPTSYYCSFCTTYDNSINLIFDRPICNDCPLYKETIFNTTKNKECCAGLWLSLTSSPTWKVFIIRAKKVLKYIKKAKVI